METFPSSLSTNPLFSSIITLYTLILIYFPSSFLGLIFSPVLISTLILLLSLLRLGASQEEKQKQKVKEKEKEKEKAKAKPKELNSSEIVTEESNSPGIATEELTSAESVPEELVSEKVVPGKLNSEGILAEELDPAENVSPHSRLQRNDKFFSNDHKPVSSQVNGDSKIRGGSNLGPGPNPLCADYFLEWDVRAPLEVIYEGCEGEEEGNDGLFEENRETQMAIIERYASLSMYYPETDTDTSTSEGDLPVIGELDSPENVGFRWDEEDVEGLIEIALDGKRKTEVEEDNLIEIDLLRRVSRLDDAFCHRENDGFSDEV